MEIEHSKTLFFHENEPLSYEDFKIYVGNIVDIFDTDEDETTY